VSMMWQANLLATKGIHRGAYFIAKHLHEENCRIPPISRMLTLNLENDSHLLSTFMVEVTNRNGFDIKLLRAS
jgi:hypothetical protein